MTKPSLEYSRVIQQHKMITSSDEKVHPDDDEPSPEAVSDELKGLALTQ
jgi:hypothetical protein